MKIHLRHYDVIMSYIENSYTTSWRNYVIYWKSLRHYDVIMSYIENPYTTLWRNYVIYWKLLRHYDVIMSYIENPYTTLWRRQIYATYAKSWKIQRCALTSLFRNSLKAIFPSLFSSHKLHNLKSGSKQLIRFTSTTTLNWTRMSP